MVRLIAPHAPALQVVSCANSCMNTTCVSEPILALVQHRYHAFHGLAAFSTPLGRRM